MRLEEILFISPNVAVLDFSSVKLRIPERNKCDTCVDRCLNHEDKEKKNSSGITETRIIEGVSQENAGVWLNRSEI